MRSRRSLHAAAFVALAAMLFAQAAFALAACDPAQASSRALMLAVHATEQANCHEPVDNANLCLAHCQGREQTLDKHQVKVPDASVHAVLPQRAFQDKVQPLSWTPRIPIRAAGPPARILFRTLLI